MNKMIRKIIPITLLILTFTIPAWAYTETFFVCQGGDGSSPKTATCATAWDANDFSTAGNWASGIDSNDGKIGANDLVIILDDGGSITGTGNDVLIFQGSGSSGKPITIQGESGGSPVIDGQNAREPIQNDGYNYITVEDLEVKNAGDTGMGIDNYTGDNLTFKNIVTHNNGATGIWTWGDNNLFQQIESYSNGQHGIYFGGTSDSSGNVVEDSYFHDNNSSGFQINTGGGNVNNTEIRYNLFKDNGYQDINEVAGIGTKIHHNVFIGTISTNYNAIFIGDIDTGPPPESTVIYNNSFYGKWDRVFNFEDTTNSTTVTFHNNAVYQADPAAYMIALHSTVRLNANNNYYYGGALVGFWYNGMEYNFTNWKTQLGGCPNNGNDCSSSQSDPKFTSSIDLTMQSDSPCIDTGEDLGATYDDALDPDSSWTSSVSTLDQDDYGDGWEIGAYVYNLIEPGTTAPWAPTGFRFTSPNYNNVMVK